MGYQLSCAARRMMRKVIVSQVQYGNAASEMQTQENPNR
jgi:hypothetical protein